MVVPITELQSSSPSSWQSKVSVETSGKPFEFELRAGTVVIIAGPNGTGKSALTHAIYKKIGVNDQAEFFPGHRQIFFSSEYFDFLQQPVEQLAANLFNNDAIAGRFRSAWSEDHLKSVLRRLSDAENQYNSDIVQALHLGNNTKLNALKAMKGPLNTVNAIFKAARLVVSFKLEVGQIKATRKGRSFKIDRMSDGERASLLIAAAVVVRKLNTVLVIDEPEKHLNPAISGALVSACIRARPDLAFVFSSHDLSFVEWLSPNIIIHLRDSKVINEATDERRYDIHKLGDDDGLSDDLRIAILGARKYVLFVEGTNTSDDCALFSLLYPGWHIVPSGDWEQVSSHVRTIGSNSSMVWLEARGIVDGDGRDEEERSNLKNKNIYCIDKPTIENLFCLKAVVEAVASAIEKFGSKNTAQQMLHSIQEGLPDVFNKERNNIVQDQIVWRVNREISAKKISRKNLSNGQDEIDKIRIEPIKLEIDRQVDEIIADLNLDSLSALPIKKTKIPNFIARNLEQINFSAYKKIVLRQIESNTVYGLKIKEDMKKYLPSLDQQA